MYIFFDIGGTNTRIAQSNDLVTILEGVKYPTPLTYAVGLRSLVEHIRKLSRSEAVHAITGGIRGPLNYEKTGIVSERTLTDWVGRNIVHDLQSVFQCDVTLENDTALVGLGEVHYGAGKGYDIVAYHTVSTGVGGARFVHGVLDVASTGFEPGHQVLDLDHTLLYASPESTLESLVSGTALQARRGVKPYEISQTDAVWDELARYLAAGLKNTIVYWSPECIILGGSMMVGDPRIPIEAVEKYTKSFVGSLVPLPKIVLAALQDNGGLYGAMALRQQSVSNQKQ